MLKKIFFLVPLCSSIIFASSIKVKENSLGIEINPIRLLLNNDNWTSVSGTLSYFDNHNGTEISMPIFYSFDKSHNAYEDEDTLLNIDLHYRRYIYTTETEGLYVGLFGRYTYLDGKARDRLGYVTIQKFGLGAEIGIKKKRIFDTPFYWGASIMLGGYLGNSNNKLKEGDFFTMELDDKQMIFDLELLKVGYEF